MNDTLLVLASTQPDTFANIKTGLYYYAAADFLTIMAAMFVGIAAIYYLRQKRGTPADSQTHNH